LQEDVAENAFAAAFRDPRFVPLSPQESQDLVLHISVLSTPEPLADCDSLAELVAQLKPFEDGLIVTLGQQRATFLPSVWEQLPDRQQFVQQLLRKAGISGWQQGIECQRYGSVSFEGHWQEIRTVE
jgi:AmmeMemoRadiSam system protein A